MNSLNVPTLQSWSNLLKIFTLSYAHSKHVLEPMSTGSSSRKAVPAGCTLELPMQSIPCATPTSRMVWYCSEASVCIYNYYRNLRI